jgi:hypothetical protein
LAIQYIQGVLAVHLLHSSDFDTAHHLKLQVTLAAPDGRERDECCMQGETAQGQSNMKN